MFPAKFFQRLAPRAQNPRWRPKISKWSKFKNSFFNLVENSISRNIKMRNFSLRPIFWTQEPKIQDGRQAHDMVQVTFFLLHLEQKFWRQLYGFRGRKIE